MTSLWSFLLQTLMVSAVALVILAVKKLLEDKLSPRWQYGVWSVLVLRILLPVDLSQKNLFSIPLWVEIAKSNAEVHLNSAYSGMFEPIAVSGIFPYVTARPNSFTDWMFIVYVAGILFFLLKYLWTYVRLKNILKKSKTASEEILQKVQSVCKTYHLKSCSVVEVEGLSSAFICGGFKTVLAVPAGADLDEKIILHEMLHLKYCDTLQNIGWCILRALHWCNPFLQYVFNRIGNDMESLCDQRVLERLEGEERREYGVILLNMANEHYARAAGTSSISNGGKNISRRIAAIVRFKKYPEGMALVSVCIVLVLASMTVWGRTGTYDTEAFTPKRRSELETAMAMTRINRCTTLAGAIDTYAKALVHDNGIFLAAASSLDKQPELYEAMKQSSEDGWEVCHLRTGDELEYLDESSGYYIINLQKLSEERYVALISFDVRGFPDPDGSAIQQVILTEDGDVQHGSVRIPIEITKEDGWIVEETGKREFVPGYSMWEMNGVEPLRVLRATGDYGTFEARIRTIHYVEEKDKQNTMTFWKGSTISETPLLNAEFKDAYLDSCTEYSLEGKTVAEAPKTYVGTMRKYMDSADEVVEFPDEKVAGDMSGSNSDGYEWSSKYLGGESGGNSDGYEWSTSYLNGGWDGVQKDSGGDTRKLEADWTVKLPKYCKVQIYWEGNLVDEMLAEEVAP